MSDTTLDQVLAARRAARAEVVDVDEPTVKLVVFELAGQRFAFPGDRVREILSDAEVFFVPGSPPSLEGVINVRGDIESVILLEGLLQLPERSGVRESSILLGRGSTMTSGIRVDRVVDVTDVSQGAFQPPPDTLPEPMRSLVRSVLQLQDRPVAVLDLDRIFDAFTRGLG